ncbi:MAG: VOC family protein [Proteobacteria bacterium]|nr:VOC family protein [Pseudomonadota bacterium]
MPEATLRTTGIDHVVLYVSDIGRSKKFYLDVLGMSVADESPRHLFLSCGGQGFALFEPRDGAPLETGRELNHLAFSVDAGTYEEIKVHLEAHGLEVTGRRDDDRCVYFRDPDGHRLQLVVPD